MKAKYLAVMVLIGAVAFFMVQGAFANGSKESSSSSGPVTITYWQYTFPTKVTEIKALVDKFQQQNPGITVVAQDFPYDQYNQKVNAAMNAGQGPDIMNLYYGWLPLYVGQDYLQPIPSDFMTNQQIEDYYIPMVTAGKVNGTYYALPIAVRSLALIWNKDLFQKAGLDPNSPPKTWDELIADAKKMTIRQANGQLQQEGFAWNVTGQGYHTFEEIFLREWGATPFSDDGKKVLWNATPNGLQAFTYWINMEQQAKIGEPDFLQNYNDAFFAGKAAMMIDGSFDVASIKKAAQFPWGVTTPPLKEVGGTPSNFGSFWANGFAKGVSGAQLAAAEKFMKFLISPDTERDWLQNIGELPAAKQFADDATINNDPIYGPFVQGLKAAHATFFVDETKERQTISDEIDKILLKNAPIPQTFDELVSQEQAIRDNYFAGK
jgi:multiple sugar transport system substrate-binding protein